MTQMLELLHRDFKATMTNVLNAVMKKADNVHAQMGNVIRG